MMNVIIAWIEDLLTPVLPADIYSRLDLLYNSTIICLGVGIIFMLAAVIFMIFAVRRGKQRTHNA